MSEIAPVFQGLMTNSLNPKTNVELHGVASEYELFANVCKSLYAGNS